MAIVYLGNGMLRGLSTDTKPTTYPAGTRFFETDTGLEYYWNGTAWLGTGSLIKAGYRYTINKIGSNHYSMKNDGSIFSSDTTGHPETVIQATIDQCETDGGGDIFICGTGAAGAYQLSGTFAGFKIGNNTGGVSPDVLDVNVVCALDAYFKIPNTFAPGTPVGSNGVFCTITNATIRCGWYGGHLYQSTPNFAWIGFELESSTQAGCCVHTLERINIRHADIAVKLSNNTSAGDGSQGFVNGNYFHDIFAYSCNTGVLFNQAVTYVSGQNSMNRNYFNNFIAEHNNRASALYGVKDVVGRDNFFLHCKIWDILQTASYHTCTITANSEYTQIVGGLMTQVGWPADNGSTTTTCNDMWSPTRLGKGQIYAHVAKTANYTATLADDTITVDGTSSAFTITLPTAAGTIGREFTIKRTDILASSNLITIATTSSQTIDSASNHYLWPGEFVIVRSDGTNWQITNRTVPGLYSYYAIKGSTADRRVIAGNMGAYASTGTFTASTTSPAANTLWALPLIVYKTTKFDLISFRDSTSSTAGNSRVGIYRDNGNCYPGALIFDSGAIVTTGTAGLKNSTITSSAQVFPTGLYWLVYEQDTATGQIMSLGGTSAIFGMYESTTFNAPVYGYSVAHTFGALPDPFTAGATPLNGAPAVGAPVPAIGLRPI